MLKQKRIKRHKGVKRRLSVGQKRARLSVFRSSQHIYAQIVDDGKGITLVAESDLKLKGSKKEKAMVVGEKLAKAALNKKIKEVTFDRGGFKYHGRVASLAEGVRKGGLNF